MTVRPDVLLPVGTAKGLFLLDEANALSLSAARLSVRSHAAS
jgi:hypothetical protein